MILFPLKHIKKQLYFLQLENYDLKRFIASLKLEKNKPLEEFRQELIWTPKLKFLVTLTLLLYLLFSLFLSFLTFNLTGYILIVSLVFFTLILVLPLLFVLFLILSVLLTWPLDSYLKGKIIKKAQQKLRQYPDLIIIGITGSYGKTSLKELLFDILSSKYTVVKTPSNINTPLGIARLIQEKISDKTQIFIVEMGAYYQNDIKKICQLTKPQISVLTGINEAHLDRFGSLDKTIQTKFEIVEHMDRNGLVLLNADNDLIIDNYRKFIADQKTLFYSFKNHKFANLKIKQKEFDPQKLQWQFNLLKGKKTFGRFTSKLLGEYSLGTISAACAIALELGLEPITIQAKVVQAKPISHRLQPIVNSSGILVIDDSYNGNPDGAGQAIQVLAKFENKRKIYLTPGLVETGDKAQKIHQNIGKQLAEVADLIILIKNSVTPFIENGLIKKGFDPNNILYFETATQAHQALSGILKAGDVILFQNDWPDNYQ